jgi:hypothetical protein
MGASIGSLQGEMTNLREHLDAQLPHKIAAGTSGIFNSGEG